jgi:hypothetical protein
MRGDDFNILNGATSITSLVLDPRVRELKVPVVVRQLVFLSPSSHSLGPLLRRFTSLAAGAVLGLQEPLILTFQFFFENDAANWLTPFSQALGRLHVRAVDPGIVGELTGFGDADVERLSVAFGAGPAGSF